MIEYLAFFQKLMPSIASPPSISSPPTTGFHEGEYQYAEEKVLHFVWVNGDRTCWAVYLLTVHNSSKKTIHPDKVGV